MGGSEAGSGFQATGQLANSAAAPSTSSHLVGLRDCCFSSSYVSHHSRHAASSIGQQGPPKLVGCFLFFSFVFFVLSRQLHECYKEYNMQQQWRRPQLGLLGDGGPQTETVWRRWGGEGTCCNYRQTSFISCSLSVPTS